MGRKIIRAVGSAALSAIWFMPACMLEPSEPERLGDAAAPVKGDAAIDTGASSDAEVAPTDAPADAASAGDAAPFDAGASDVEGGAPSLDAGPGPEAEDAGCEGAACSDPLAPFALDCNNLPVDGACQGGPREVLLVSERSGLIAMFDPEDGHFLGYFKRPGEYTDNFLFATQGPDQCIWSVTKDSGFGVQRWDTDGSFKDAPLKPHYVPVSGGPHQPVVRTPTALAFTRDHAYVATTHTDPSPRIVRFNLKGEFEAVVAEFDRDIASMLVLGDGSLLLSHDAIPARLTRLGVDGQDTPLLGDLTGAGQVAYAGQGQALIAEWGLGDPVHRVNIETGEAFTVYPNTPSWSNKYGIAPLRNGDWLLTGGQFYVSALDPDSTHPPGQYELRFTDRAVRSTAFYHIGRACLSEAFLASRAPKPPQNTCIEPPDGPVLFEEDFDAEGDFTGEGVERHYRAIYDGAATGFTASLGQAPGGNPTRALKLSGSGRVPSGQIGFRGVYARFQAGHPRYARYRVYVPTRVAQTLGVLELQHGAKSSSQSVSLLSTFIYNGDVRADYSLAQTDTHDFAGRWVTIEMRNIDWQLRTYDLYADCTRVAEGIHMPLTYGDRVDRLELFNYTAASPDAYTVAWVDDILIK